MTGEEVTVEVWTGYHARVHGDEPGAAGPGWVLIVGPAGSGDLSLGLGDLPPTELLLWTGESSHSTQVRNQVNTQVDIDVRIC